MINFSKIASDSYVVYVNGSRVTDTPLSHQELCEMLCDISLSESDMKFIENFY